MTGSAAAILDIDGTLVDTNYQHAIAWYRAFRHHGLTLPMWRIHYHIGMGGDQIVPALAGEEFAEEHAKEVRDTEKGCYRELIDEVEPLPGARALLERLTGREARLRPGRLELPFADDYELAELAEALERALAGLEGAGLQSPRAGD